MTQRASAMNTPLQLNLLAIDDDILILNALQSVMEPPWNFISQQRFVPVDDVVHVAFVDIHLNSDFHRAEGLDIIRSLSLAHPNAEIIAMSGDLDRTLMEQTLKAGATRFLPKPLTAGEVLSLLEKLVALFQLRGHRHRDVTPWVGRSPASEHLRRQIAHLKGETSPVLIEGESGTGKDVIAHLLHRQEPPRPFVAINVAALPETLFEAEFFGTVKGAFTGASHSKMGLAESAHGGDLFLDEIEALSLPLQAKLLRFLESGEVRRIGATESIRVQTRVIAASNENLQQKVRDGKFREDLLWRLSAHRLHSPSLRTRLEDLPELCEFFLSRIKPTRQKKWEPEAFLSLSQHLWPGNVRELKHACEQLALLSPLPIIRAEDVKKILSPEIAPAPEVRLDLERGLSSLMNDFEKKILETALQREKDIDALAKLLKISRSSLYKKFKDYSLSG